MQQRAFGASKTNSSRLCSNIYLNQRLIFLYIWLEKPRFYLSWKLITLQYPPNIVYPITRCMTALSSSCIIYKIQNAFFTTLVKSGMPEIAEVAHFMEYFAPKITGRCLYKIEVSDKYPCDTSSFDNMELHSKVVKVTSYGKKGLIVLECGTIVISFGMEGRLNPKVTEGKTLVSFWFGDDFPQYIVHRKVISYENSRKIGCDITFTKEYTNSAPEMLHNPPDEKTFVDLISKLKTRKSIANVMLDQHVIAGIGNYLRAEILYDCKTYPGTPTCKLTIEQKKGLYISTLKIIKKAYDWNGATIKSYRNPDGAVGEFKFCVYSCDKCPLGHKVTYDKFGDGRKTYYCPKCQVE